ncbi:MAG: M56 family metallopeptidase, partial [Saprospiraceae bacterium]|nr:M56 family metallopeptidase [Saprospiraceae bacterium]
FGTLLAMLASAIITFVILTGSGAQPEAVVGSIAAPGTEISASGLTAWLNANLDLLVAIWMIGMGILLFRLGIGLLYIERLKRSARPIGPSLETLGKRISRQLQYHKVVRIAQTTAVQIPVVVGFLKPVILFPVGAVNRLSTEEVEAVLAHELAHLVRHDFVQNLVQSLIEIVFYYHPAVWWISAMVRSERENCCDDLAVRACSSSLTYARALVQLQDLGGKSPALALPFSGPKHHLLHRIQRILNQPQNKSNVMEKITATALLVVCLILASFTGNPDRNDQPTPGEQSLWAYMVTDTVPPAPRIIVHRTVNGEETELVYENGKVITFKVNGVEVPESEFAQHQTLIDELIQEARNVPAPPPPPPAPLADEAPPAPGAPAALPAPPASETMPALPTPAAPPAPPAVKGKLPKMPPPPPPPPAPKVKKRTETLILRETDEAGNTVYRIESEGGGKSHIMIDEAASLAVIDGQEIVIDADSIIVIEEVETELPFGHVWTPRMLVADSLNIRLGENYFFAPGENYS